MSKRSTDPASDDETAHVRRAQSGDRAAFEPLVASSRPALLAFAFSRTGNRDSAEDLVQEAILLAWSRLNDLQDPAMFRPWLRSIILNLCRSWHRRSRLPCAPLDGALEDSIPDGKPGLLAAALLSEEEFVMRAVLRLIPEPNRIALLMHLWGDYSYEEIAESVGVPVTTIEGRIYRARQQIRERLKERADDLLGEGAFRGVSPKPRKKRSGPT